MDAYLLPRRDGTFFLYSGELQPPATGAVDPTDGLARRALAHLRRAYEWVSQRRRRQEHLLKSLGEITTVRIHHASTLSDAQARSVYDALIQAAIAKHQKWMIANAAALPLSVPLSLVPGPNVLLGYLAWRSVVHYQSRKAGQRATALPIDLVPEPTLSDLTDLVPEPTLSDLTDLVRRRMLFGRKRRIRELGEQLGLHELDHAY